MIPCEACYETQFTKTRRITAKAWWITNDIHLWNPPPPVAELVDQELLQEIQLMIGSSSRDLMLQNYRHENKPSKERQVR